MRKKDRNRFVVTEPGVSGVVISRNTPKEIINKFKENNTIVLFEEDYATEEERKKAIEKAFEEASLEDKYKEKEDKK